MVCIMLITLLLAQREFSMGDCDYYERRQLSRTCVGAIFYTTTPTLPTPMCCTTLKEHTHCLCLFLDDRNPYAQHLLNNAKNATAACGVSFPTCYFTFQPTIIKD